jgi:hypothetical protein
MMEVDEWNRTILSFSEESEHIRRAYLDQAQREQEEGLFPGVKKVEDIAVLIYYRVNNIV